MRILFDSKELLYKEPFGTLTPNQTCKLNIHIPASVEAVRAVCVLHLDGTQDCQEAVLEKTESQGRYEIFSGSFSFEKPGLYFYYFRIEKADGSFRLFKDGNRTNMEAGDLWQVSCVPEDFQTPDWAKGAVIYQIFPDRFCREGQCDLSGKLEPYTVHARWDEEVEWAPNKEGIILNNDFYGGNFRGIISKLDYLASLGITVLYLNPISKSFSSHRYDTGDYKTPDPMLGTLAEFRELCQKAHEKGMRVILDGVYSHTGSNSLYFNKEGAFPSLGAYQSEKSPYYSWYTFYQHPNNYHSWWDFDTLPTVKKMDPSFIEYIITGEDSVVAHWLRQGADGFRLDVADELPNEFMALLKKRVRELKPDALVMGEVWEDASNKEAYGVRRRYFVDGTLDSVMNYPFRTAIINFLRDRDDGHALRDAVMTICENYPPQVVACNMNLLGTHDTARILTALVDDFDGSRKEKARRHLSPNLRAIARERLLAASFLQYMLPGSPSLYYADEALMEGYKDPFNRRTYPWGQEDQGLIAHFRELGQLRKDWPCLGRGEIRFFQADEGRLGFTRSWEGKQLRVYVNNCPEEWEISEGKILYGYNLRTVAPDWMVLAPMGFCVAEV